MPVHFAAPPANGTTLVEAGLNRLASRRSPLSDIVVNFSALQVSQPHAVYDLRPGGVAQEAAWHPQLFGLPVSRRRGRRKRCRCRSTRRRRGAATRLANINYGPYVEATAQALTQVAALPAAGAASYEVRLLRSSPIYLIALWLKPDSGGGYHLSLGSRARAFRPTSRMQRPISSTLFFPSRRSGRRRPIRSPDLCAMNLGGGRARGVAARKGPLLTPRW